MTAEAEFLSPAEVRDATGGKRSLQEQAQVLTEQGIPHRVVGRRILVSRYHVREWLAGRPVTPHAKPRLELAR